MQNFDAVIVRLKTACGVKTDTDLARALDIAQGSIVSARKRGLLPPNWVQKVALKYGVSTDWLFFGRGEMKYVEGQKHAQTVPAVPAAQKQAAAGAGGADVEIKLIPMVEAKLSAGHGSFEVDASSERKYAFRADFLSRKGQANQMVLMRVAGDSMAPAIEDGDTVLIDQSQTSPVPGKIYAVGVEDLVYLKKIDALPGKLILSSINPAYPPLEIDTRDQLEDGIRIIGRAIWWCREG